MPVVYAQDPGTRTGHCVMDRGKILHLKTNGKRDAISHMCDLYIVYRFKRAVIEMPKLGVFYASHEGQGGVNSPSGRIKLMQNVGQNIAFSLSVCEKLEEIGVKVYRPNPKKGTTKWEFERWCRIFEWEGRHPSNHARDASVLAFMYENWVGFNLPEVGK